MHRIIGGTLSLLGRWAGRGRRLAVQVGLGAAFVVGAPGAAWAWNAHAVCTWPALQGLAELAPLKVRAESLERFLAAEAPRLERLLAEHEAWARAHLEPYAPRPDALAFKAPGPGAAPGPAGDADLRLRFLNALRVNVGARLPLFLQLRPGEPPGARPHLAWTEVTTLASGGGARGSRFVALAEGDEVAVTDVVGSASQEPDFGLDVGLFADSGTAHGRSYGFGEMPFGNPALEYATQAPFHMGFYHEARIIFAAGAFLRRTHPEARIALFTTLARHALASGHEYWGWRFAGWALHYVQDLTQPYHARLLPGISVLSMLLTQAVALAGWEGPKTRAVTLASNRHTLIESYQEQRLTQALRDGRSDDPLLAALRETGRDAGHWRYLPTSARTLVSQEAFDAAPALDAQIARSFPPRYTSDPGVNLGPETDDLDLVGIARQHSAAEQERLDQQLAARLQRLGVHTRALLRELLGDGALPTPRP
jgi:hypothetical protein